MSTPASLEQLLFCLVQLIGRATVAEARVRELVGNAESSFEAYNLCDGTFTQKEISKKLHIDQGQLSRMFTRWVEAGIAFRIGEESESRLIHVYPISRTIKAKSRAVSRKGRRT